MTGSNPRNGRILPSWGSPLDEKDYTALAASWIAREIADGGHAT